MKFTISSTALLKQLQHLQTVVPSNGKLPILDNCLLEADGKWLILTASDLETTICTSIPVEGKTKGSVALPAKMLTKALRIMPDQHLTFVADKRHLVRITGDLGTYEIMGVNPGEFPKTPEVKKPAQYTLPPSILSSGIERTVWACGSDELRPVMSGVLFEMNKQDVRLVATDAHKLIIQTYLGIKNSKPDSFIVPQRTLRVLKQYMKGTSGDVGIYVSEGYAAFHFDSTKVLSHLVDAKYPNYESVMPKEQPTRFTVNRMQLLNAVRRMDVFSNRTTHQVSVVVDEGGVTLSTKDYNFMSMANERLGCAPSGPPLTVGFNARLLAHVLRSLNGEDIVVRLDKPNRAATLVPAKDRQGETTLALLMPVMLND